MHGFDAGEMILRVGDPGRSVYVVLSGRVRIFLRDHHGDMLELAILDESEFFDEMSLLTGKPRAIHVEAVDKSVLMYLSSIVISFFRSRMRGSSAKAV